jgi:AcrR family transcriptional regulator
VTSQRPTRERILEASRRLFNDRGYAATPVADIAKSVGISTGNLTYHFPAKLDIVTELATRARLQYRDSNARPHSGPIADTYVEIVRFAMNHAWQNRFLLRDRAQFGESQDAGRADPDTVADVEMAHELLQRVQSAGMFRDSLDLDLRVLARSLWIVSRFWMDHLSEAEGLAEVTWADQERGLQHHFALLFPCLHAAGKREFASALERLAGRHGTFGETVPDLAAHGSAA